MKLALIPVVRYWDHNPQEILSNLERFRQCGVSSLMAFVPWAHLEADRQQLLKKFVQHSLASGFSLQLCISPELGIGYSNGGVPDDLLRDRQNLAQDRLGQPFYACVPPNIHPLVSLLAPSVFQRYGHFLLKLTQELSEVLSISSERKVELVVSDSLFKHYRNAGLSDSDHGDFSIRHMQFGAGYRKEEWTAALAERIFLTRAFDFLESRFSKFKGVSVVSRCLYGRRVSQERLVEELIAAGPNHADLFRSLVKARSSCDTAWLDDLHQLRDKEKNFLISSSLAIFGEVWLNEYDFWSLSDSFRKKMLNLVDAFSSGETEFSRPAISLVQNRFSPARISCLLQDKLGSALKFKTSLSEVGEEERSQTKLFAVEEGYNLEFRQFMELLSIAEQRDCTVVTFRSSLCESGLKEFKKLKTFRLNHGWLFEIGIFPNGGHVLLIEGQEHSQLSMDTLGDSLVSVARIEPFCSFGKLNRGVISVAVDWKTKGPVTAPNEFMRTVFLMNPEVEARKLNLEFQEPVRIQGIKSSGTGGAAAKDEGYGNSFETELPPLSVIPLSVFSEIQNLEQEKSTYGNSAELA